jgi:hypothetical protein
MLWTQNLLIQCGNVAITVGANRRIMGGQTAEDDNKTTATGSEAATS